MALVTAPCISTGDGLVITITYDNVTTQISSLTVVNNSALTYTVGFTYGNRGGTRSIAPGVNTTISAPNGAKSTDEASIWID